MIKALLLASALLFVGCSEAEMASFEQGLADAKVNNQRYKPDMYQMERDCKDYLSGKISLPMAAFTVMPGYGSNGDYRIPYHVKWDEPFVDERGYCVIQNGIVRNSVTY